MESQHVMVWIVRLHMMIIILYAVIVQVRPWVEKRGDQLFFVGKRD